MYRDYQNEFSDEQAITATGLSDNSVFMGEDSPATMVPLFFKVDEAFNNLTTLTVTVQTSATVDANGDLNGTVVDLVSTDIALADLVLSAEVPIQVLPKDMLAYSQLNYTVTGTAPTTGKVSAGVVVDLQTNG